MAFQKTSRRNFLLGSVATATAIGCSRRSKSTLAAMDIPSTMPERTLGKTNISLPVLGLGGAGNTPISRASQTPKAIALIEKALELGIRYFDTAEMYGVSEQQFGTVLPPFREQIYLNSKTDARDYDGAWRHLEKSLKLLKTDYLDCWQIHHLSFDEELERIFLPDGAVKAMTEAKEQGIVKFTGVTGHREPDIIIKALERYDFDTTLISLNAADIHHPRPFAAVLPVAQAQNVGVIAMKVPAYGRLFKPNLLSGMEQAMGYSLSLPGVHCCIIAAENPQQLEANVEVARSYQPFNAEQMKQIEQLTANAGADGAFFRNWS